MGGKKTETSSSKPTVTHADIELELHRLHESQMRLVLMAEELGVAAPRSCCRHKGSRACAPCTAEWLASHASEILRSATEEE